MPGSPFEGPDGPHELQSIFMDTRPILRMYTALGALSTYQLYFICQVDRNPWRPSTTVLIQDPRPLGSREILTGAWTRPTTASTIRKSPPALGRCSRPDILLLGRLHAALPGDSKVVPFCVCFAVLLRTIIYYQAKELHWSLQVCSLDRQSIQNSAP